MLQPAELAYIAGVIDGEGTIGIYRLRSPSRYQMKLCISNTSWPLLEWIRERVGGALVCVAKATSKHREGWQLVVSQYQAAPLLLGCREYLQVKQAQADLACVTWTSTDPQAVIPLARRRSRGGAGIGMRPED